MIYTATVYNALDHEPISSQAYDVEPHELERLANNLIEIAQCDAIVQDKSLEADIIITKPGTPYKTEFAIMKLYNENKTEFEIKQLPRDKA